MIAKKLPLTLDSDAFNAFKADFNQMLRKLLLTMETQESEEGKLAVAMTVKLDKGHARDYQANGHDATRDIVTPTFSHKVSIALSFKDDKSGTLKGDYEMHWDKELGAYVIEEINNGQTSFFDEDQSKEDDAGEADDAEEETEETEEEEPLGLPENATEEADGVVSVDEHTEDPEISPEMEAYLEQKETFIHMLRYVDCEMKILESNGMYSIRDIGANSIILTTAGEGLTCCSPDVVKKHMGHKVVCHANGFDGDPTRITISCLDCEEELWHIDIPEEPEPPVIEDEPVMDGGEYEYEQPEE